MIRIKLKLKSKRSHILYPFSLLWLNNNKDLVNVPKLMDRNAKQQNCCHLIPFMQSFKTRCLNWSHHSVWTQVWLTDSVDMKNHKLSLATSYLLWIFNERNLLWCQYLFGFCRAHFEGPKSVASGLSLE